MIKEFILLGNVQYNIIFFFDAELYVIDMKIKGIFVDCVRRSPVNDNL